MLNFLQRIRIISIITLVFPRDVNKNCPTCPNFDEKLIGMVICGPGDVPTSWSSLMAVVTRNCPCRSLQAPPPPPPTHTLIQSHKHTCTIHTILLWIEDEILNNKAIYFTLFFPKLLSWQCFILFYWYVLCCRKGFPMIILGTLQINIC